MAADVYLLTLHGLPLIGSKDFEALNEYMARYTPAQQAHMEIKELQMIT